MSEVSHKTDTNGHQKEECNEYYLNSLSTFQCAYSCGPAHVVIETAIELLFAAKNIIQGLELLRILSLY